MFPVLLMMIGCDSGSTRTVDDATADTAQGGDETAIVDDVFSDDLSDQTDLSDQSDQIIVDEPATDSDELIQNSTWCRDSDLDGFGDPNDTAEGMSQPDGYVADCTDCDDDEPKKYPGARELAGDGIDQDCDGVDRVSCTDIGCDGYPDIVFCNTDTDDGLTNINSYLYLGSATGYSELNRIDIPTIGAMGAHIADANRDGYLDIAFAAVKEMKEGDEAENRYTTSLLYYGTADGFDLENRVEFPSVGASDVTLTDLDKDGWPDFIVSNRYNGSGMSGSGYKINSYIYWGSENGFDINNKLELPTVGAALARVADLNNDGFNDIVFPNGVQEYVGVFESYIYWGTGPGKDAWGTGNRSTLPSVSPEAATVSDINDDGYLDIFITGWLCLTQCGLKNRIYWNSATGFDEDRYTAIADLDGGTDAIFTDLNGDGVKDMTFANGSVTDLLTQEFAKESYVLWGTLSGNADKYAWSASNKLALPATASSEMGVEDLNGDGYPDIVFASHYAPDDSSPQVSQIYWGSADGYLPANVTELPTQHAAGMKIIGTYTAE
jgi:hypothetical protein